MRLAWDAQSRGEAPAGGYNRERSADLYHTNRWTRLSRVFRASHPLCEECKRQGIIKAAAVVDHIVPHRGDQRLFWDQSNWQPLCKGCHDKKTGSGY